MSTERTNCIRLLGYRGHPGWLAVRVFETPPFTVVPNGEMSDRREGAELAQAIDALTGDVAWMIAVAEQPDLEWRCLP